MQGRAIDYGIRATWIRHKPSGSTAKTRPIYLGVGNRFFPRCRLSIGVHLVNMMAASMGFGANDWKYHKASKCWYLESDEMVLAQSAIHSFEQVKLSVTLAQQHLKLLPSDMLTAVSFDPTVPLGKIRRGERHPNREQATLRPEDIEGFDPATYPTEVGLQLDTIHEVLNGSWDLIGLGINHPRAFFDRSLGRIDTIITSGGLPAPEAPPAILHLYNSFSDYEQAYVDFVCSKVAAELTHTAKTPLSYSIDRMNNYFADYRTMMEEA